jgi:hypothetical protein
MSQTPSIDYRCTRYGARWSYQLAPVDARPTEEETKPTPTRSRQSISLFSVQSQPSARARAGQRPGP